MVDGLLARPGRRDEGSSVGVTQRRFGGSVALVTGAAAGIGRAVATRLATEGAAVVVLDVLDEAGSATVEEIRTSGGRAVMVAGDVAEEVGRRHALEAAASLGGLDVLVNNAADLSERTLLDADGAYWQRVLSVNLIAPAMLLREATSMLSTGGGAVVNVSSVRALASVPGAPAYEASKAGMLALTRAAAVELAGLGVRVNAVCPGFVPSSPEAADALAPAVRAAWFGVGVPHGNPSVVASAVAFLASSDAEFVNGSVLVVDGGAGAQHPFAAALRTVQGPSLT